MSDAGNLNVARRRERQRLIPWSVMLQVAIQSVEFRSFDLVEKAFLIQFHQFMHRSFAII